MGREKLMLINIGTILASAFRFFANEIFIHFLFIAAIYSLLFPEPFGKWRF
jgi:hypothetical protein